MPEDLIVRDAKRVNDSTMQYSQESIQSKILTIRGVQVMLDSDVAMFFCVEVKRVNEQVKRNLDRFPEDFVFRLTKEEAEVSRSQNATLKQGMNIKYLPYAFTEAGVSQLASVIKNATAAVMSVQIIRAFVAMRRFLIANAAVFQRLETVEMKQIAADRKIDAILDRLDDGTLKPRMGIFFDNEMFDADVLVEQIVSKAERRIVLVDDYITAEILQRFHRYAAAADIDCYVKSRMESAALDRIFADFRRQYPAQHCQLHTFEKSHDRWLIIDDTVYHFGASIKDLGKKWFAVSVMTELSAEDLLARLQ